MKTWKGLTPVMRAAFGVATHAYPRWVLIGRGTGISVQTAERLARRGLVDLCRRPAGLGPNEAPSVNADQIKIACWEDQHMLPWIRLRKEGEGR